MTFAGTGMAGDPRRARGVTRLVIPTPDDETAARARDLARQVAAYWDDRLGPELLGFYLLGSLAPGGFRRPSSAIHLGLGRETGVCGAPPGGMGGTGGMGGMGGMGCAF